MLDPVEIIRTSGYIGVTAIIFAECGLFFGFFLPGDSLLFTLGFLASQTDDPIIPLLLALVSAAFAGEWVGYTFGKFVGPKIWNRPRSRFFNPTHVARAEEFFRKHGNKAIFLARFMPIVRTFVPIMAGVAHMPRRAFFLYNILGAIVWAGGLTFFGYQLGSLIPSAEKYLYPIIITIIIVSFIPAIREWRRSKKQPV